MKRKKSSKKEVQRNFNIVILLFLLFIGFSMFDRFLDMFNNSVSHLKIVQNSSIDNVAKYGPLIHDELKNVNLEEHTITVAALMMQESKGRGGDPMQASESAGLAPNTINDPKKSIQQGVGYFQKAISYGEQRQVDFPTVIQAYNMGLGYIDFVAQNGKKHSEALAKEYSMIQVEKNPQIYNCRGDKNNFRYPYCYGDFTYSTKVAKHMKAITVENPEELSTKASF